MVVALDVLEQYRARVALELGGDAGEVLVEVDLGPNADQPPHGVQIVDDLRQIGQMLHTHGSLPDPPAVPNRDVGTTGGFILHIS